MSRCRTTSLAYHAESSPPRPPTPRIAGARDVYVLCEPMTRYRVEVFRVLLLNTRHELLRRVTVSRGTLSATLVHPRDVFRPAVLASAAAVIAVHNHPSGDPDPSPDDVEITVRLTRSGEILGIPLLDHVIVAQGGQYRSLRDKTALSFDAA